MNLTIQLTDQQAKTLAEQILRVDAAVTASLPAMQSEPDLHESPEGFHPAIMGPIRVGMKFKSDDVALWVPSDNAWQIGALGTCDVAIYALRIGSEIARLNGLGLKLELGRTYATNSGEIVSGLVKHGLTGMPEQDAYSADVSEWNSIGQALIDGVPQPLSHDDSIKEEIPSELLPLPKLPAGFKEWRARGFGWTNGREECCMAVTQHDGKFGVFHNSFPSGDAYPDRYYLEAIHCTPDDVFGPEAIPAENDPEPRKAREFVLTDDFICNRANVEDGSELLQDNESIRVREILPGEPTPEQVQALVDALEFYADTGKYVATFTGGFGQLYFDCGGRAQNALTPFREKK